ncbi:MAG: NTP transferase domain-containing protein [Deltaproteobacteria bacterium]|nr:NTP transferase domain-containing protein [Deltaproteobacteria bacterium]
MSGRATKKPELTDNPALAVIILAAGQGKRMKSDRPKVLHELMGRTLLDHVLHAAGFLSPRFLVVVTGVGASEVERSAPPTPNLTFVRQEQQLGTGHAAASAGKVLAGFKGSVVILPGDVPMVSPQTLLDLVAAHKALKADLSCLTVSVPEPAAYGRVIRDEAGWLMRIVEARDATSDELAINEINSGLYVFDSLKLFEALAELKPNNVQGEYYLTDTVSEFRARGYKAAAVLSPEPDEVQGINDRIDLARAQSVLRSRINAAWLAAGVTMADPSTTHIEATVRLSRDVTLGPGVVLTGNTRIESGASIGPYACLSNVQVGPGLMVGPHESYSGAVLYLGRKTRRRPVRRSFLRRRV